MTQENLPLFVYGTLKRGESREKKWPFPPVKVVAATTQAATTHVVVAGESLWSIARDRVGDGDALLPYWRALCDANRASLRSGDANVIYPGETVVLPD